MENRFVSDYLSKKIFHLSDFDFDSAKREYIKYLHDYPIDYRTWFSYISLLIDTQEFDLANDKLNYVEKLLYSDKVVMSDLSIKYSLFKKVYFYRVRVLCYLEKYKDLYELLKSDKNKYYNIEYSFHNSLILYCRKKMGKRIMSDSTPDSYKNNQIINYSYDLMLEHIKKHLFDFNFDYDESQVSIFVRDFPIELILGEVKKYFNCDNRLCLGIYTDYYFFKFDFCGRDKGKISDFFKVVCFHNSSDIITIHPEIKKESYPCIDLNYLKNNTVKSNVKVLSQRDKFYARYGVK